jgi:lysyl-tRNA synthetase class II
VLAQPINVALAGRMMLKRLMGKVSFAALQDMSGRATYIAKDLGEEV